LRQRHLHTAPAPVAAITHNPVVQKFYRKLLDQKKHQRAAMTAAMRKLVHICFGVLKNQQAFSPTMWRI
jgi:hypothetical protein